ncbi:glycosyltransferase [Verrucomicrobia bacterium]|nr:glycosyltransferase [Verrucomicrobiota bacterium]
MLTAVVTRFTGRKDKRLVWGEAPIINNVYWARAMEEAGFFSETFTDQYCWSINKREQYDLVIQEMFWKIPLRLKYYIGFLYSLFRYDIFFLSFNGFFLWKTLLHRLEPILLKIANKKIVLLPFGGDAYVYRRLRAPNLIHVLNQSLPGAARRQVEIAKRVDRWCRHADFVIPAGMGPDGLGRWDVLIPNSLCVDVDSWKTTKENNMADGRDDLIKVTHSPNFRGFKGTEFVIEAVEALKEEGLNVELILLEKMQNEEVKKVLRESSDIHVEQLVFTGFGLNAIEAMATGLPVVSNLEEESITRPFRRWSYLNECPLVSSTPERLVEDLRKLVTRPELRKELGRCGRLYTKKYHSYQASQFLFTQVLEYLDGKRESLMNMYNPLESEYLSDEPKLSTPLFENKIID